jgi:aminoglycoside phosphotransferase family enzyme/predicted kinase
VPRKRKRRTRPRPSRNSLPDSLTDPRCFGRGVSKVQLVETHVSWVFLTGRHAYKVKKPVKLPFVDFSTLALRHRYCREELRVNRRLARELYLGIVPIGGSPAAPRIGRKPAFEYAVKMREFASSARLDRRLQDKGLPPAALARFGARLAEFHRQLPPIRNVTGAEAGAAALRNLREVERSLGRDYRHELTTLRAWTEGRCASLTDSFAQRAAAGAHRECHGDLHLQNLLWSRGAIEAFDALEFDRALRDIDVISEAAFLAMDLHAHGRVDLGYEFLNRYLESSGDYAGVDVLPFYLVYRALVRAKVAAIKRTQTGARDQDHTRYLKTALELAADRRPLLVITHGLSGSGKTHVTDGLVGPLHALRARSDIERKRLHGLDAAARTGSAVGAGLYAATATRRTYAELAVIADRLLRNGQTALIDATFLRRNERLEFRQIAAANAAPFAILDCRASPRELRRRIAARNRAGHDPSEADFAVLEDQLRRHEPLDRAERRAAVTVDTEGPIRYAKLAERLRRS